MTDQSTTSPTLLGRVQQNEAQAWQTLVDLYSGYIRALLLRNQCRPDDLDDLTQDVLMTLARKIPDFRPQEHKGAFRGWLKSIVRSKSIDAYRQNQRSPAADGGTEGQIRMNELSDSNDASAEALDDSDPQEQSALRSLYQRAMRLVEAECDPRTWQIFYRVVVKHEQAAMVAKELGISAASIRMSKSRIIRRLREIVGEPLADDSSSQAR